MSKLNKFVAVALVCSISGCSFLKSSVLSNLKACGEAALAKETQHIYPQVANILLGGTADWKSQLAALEVTAGSAVLCAIANVLSDLQSKMHGARPSPKAIKAMKHGREYLASKNLK